MSLIDIRQTCLDREELDRVVPYLISDTGTDSNSEFQVPKRIAQELGTKISIEFFCEEKLRSREKKGVKTLPSGSNTKLNVRLFHGECTDPIAGCTEARPRPPEGSRRYFEKGISNHRSYSAGNY